MTTKTAAFVSNKKGYYLINDAHLHTPKIKLGQISVPVSLSLPKHFLAGTLRKGLEDNATMHFLLSFL